MRESQLSPKFDHDVDGDEDPREDEEEENDGQEVDEAFLHPERLRIGDIRAEEVHCAEDNGVKINGQWLVGVHSSTSGERFVRVEVERRVKVFAIREEHCGEVQAHFEVDEGIAHPAPLVADNADD